MTRIRTLLSLGISVATLSISSASGQMQLSAPNNNVLIYGCAQGYTVTNVPSSFAILGVDWRWKQNNSSCTVWSETMHTQDGSCYYIETIPGTFTVEALVTYQYIDYSTFPPTPKQDKATLSCTATVPPPDAVQIVPNPYTIGPVLADGGLYPVTMKIMCKGHPICMVQPGTQVRENLINIVSGGVPLPAMYGIGSPPLLDLSGTQVVDHKGTKLVPGEPITNYFDNAAVGASFYSATQTLVLWIPDYCGDLHSYNLAPFNFTFNKASPDAKGRRRVTITISQ